MGAMLRLSVLGGGYLVSKYVCLLEKFSNYDSKLPLKSRVGCVINGRGLVDFGIPMLFCIHP